jgi:hypothetical protein
MASIIVPASADPQGKQIGSWNVYQLKDPIVDQPRVIALIENKTDGAWFRIACERGKPWMAVWTRQHRYQDGDRVAVAYKIDNNEPLVAEWGYELGTGIAGIGLSRPTLTALSSAKTIALQLFFRSKHSEEPIVVVFNAVKTTEAVRPVLEACPIEKATPKSAAKLFHPYEPVFEESPSFIERWRSLNETCRGGGANEEETNQACEERLMVENKLKTLGCSFQHSTGEWACKE